ncbi:MAG TPA: glycosyltransferase family 4 protein [Lacipirellulaceae bacterium]|jgi:glycosyltransferase involved in cell wall biosynthesis|nr:glycosyltransferase family 4 protein [Lacipirellulaceae bacterium]
MTSKSEIQNQTPFVWAMAALPPPITGMTVLTEKVVEGLQRKQPVRVSNWSSGDDRRRLHTRALRVFRASMCYASLISHGRVRNAKLYLTSNHKSGLHFTKLFVKTGRRLGYRIYLHHHAYNYIDHFDSKMAAINASMGPHDVHLVHCPQMIEDFKRKYPVDCQFDYVFPSIVSLPLSRPRIGMPTVFRLGTLANLTVEKGLDIVLTTFRALHTLQPNVRLTLAGPCGSAEAERLVAAAVREHHGLVEHIGAVYGERKQQFFDSIDCFLFPSKWNAESWGIVLNEALAAGVPVIASNRGCIRTLVGGHAGLVVDDPTTYVDTAVRQIETWRANQQDYVATSRAAIEQADYLHRQAALQLERLATHICSPGEPSKLVAGQ